VGHACLLARGEIPLGWSCTAGRERRRWPKAERGFASTPVTRSNSIWPDTGGPCNSMPCCVLCRPGGPCVTVAESSFRLI